MNVADASIEVNKLSAVEAMETQNSVNLTRKRLAVVGDNRADL